MASLDDDVIENPKVVSTKSSEVLTAVPNNSFSLNPFEKGWKDLAVLLMMLVRKKGGEADGAIPCVLLHAWDRSLPLRTPGRVARQTNMIKWEYQTNLRKWEYHWWADIRLEE